MTLPSYARVTIYNSYEHASNVVFDAKAAWLESLVQKSGLIKNGLLSYEDIFRLQSIIKKRWSRKFWNLTDSESMYSEYVQYFDQPQSFRQNIEVLLVLAAAALFKNYTKIDFRIVHLKKSSGMRRAGLAIKLHHNHKSEIFFFDATLGNPSLQMKSLETLVSLGWSLCEQPCYISKSQSVWQNQEKCFSIFGEKGQEILFQVAGRTPTEKRFDKEDEQVKVASADQMIPVEICYHPFWRPLGHTTLRVGKSLFELSAHGWRAHTQGSNTARAFLFNNPFFKKQLALFANQGMPPMSLGVTFKIEKAKVDRLLIILENLTAAQGRQAEKFSLISNNCNQGIVRVLTQAGISGFDFKGYQEFSTVLTFRSLLLNCPHPIEGVRFYPLPNTEFDEATARRWIPTLLYRQNSSGQELRRALPVFPKDFIYINYRRILDYFRGRDVQKI